MKITRHVVTVGTRRVHYFRAGAGPAVAMLHACPVSAKVMLPLMRIFARRFTCLAFDMPGFGQSDPLPKERPSIEDFADGLRETLDALGIRRVASYGRHTGASIAVEFAARHPDRCTMALADGYAVFSNPYTDEELERYLEPIVPVWDGAHLLRLWFRYRDQHAFWPWNRQDDAHRSDTDVPDTSSIHRSVIEMLEAGNGYRTGYRAPFRHRGLGVLPDLKVPVCFGNRPGDSMYKTRPLYPRAFGMQISRATFSRHPRPSLSCLPDMSRRSRHRPRTARRLPGGPLTGSSISMALRCWFVRPGTCRARFCHFSSCIMRRDHRRSTKV